jgi:Ca2+/H+ antiporter, TMEM165/GDT1 family
VTTGEIVVAVVAFIGNALTVVAAAWWGDAIRAWWRRRHDKDESPSRRATRGQRIARRYGLPGLAAISPLITGSHVAVLIALGMGAGARETAGWVCLSLAIWTVAITIATLGGMELVPVDRLPRLALL